ncbi:prohibitin family protein [Bifidobacterium platyrrhinorum]|uniref:Prohibitin family protein n=1 Tax=Bifidobacterium platyrrhinorum TaxID=2661628 RepID=A0A6L9STR8_9BIFI|nr:prohibitin family protein [Bifidobacterium platyrrhinorum]NEG55405.1 prohibitin family protein [Bifidobacterium platyrrhinorum]
MILFIIALVVIILTGIVIVGGLGNKDGLAVVGGSVGLLVGGVLMFPAFLWSQDVGQSAVIVNWGGSIAGQNSDAGFHGKLPWQSVKKYDTRNNIVNLYRDAKYKYDGGGAEGKTVTVNDKSGASADIDIQVIYSLDPNKVEALYRDYGSQTTFTQSLVVNDLRSVARAQSGRFDTLTMLTDRGEYKSAVQKALSSKWRKAGLTVEQVTVQDVRYSKTITSKYNEAQAAEIARQKAVNEQETAKVEAETKKIKAQGEADANRVLNESLTDNVLKQKYIDALGNAKQLIITPDGADTLIQTK